MKKFLIVILAVILAIVVATALFAGSETAAVLNDVDKIKNRGALSTSSMEGCVQTQGAFQSTKRLLVMTAGTGTSSTSGQTITLPFTYTSAASYSVAVSYVQVTGLVNDTQVLSVSKTAANIFVVYGSALQYDYQAIGY